MLVLDTTINPRTALRLTESMPLLDALGRALLAVAGHVSCLAAWCRQAQPFGSQTSDTERHKVKQTNAEDIPGQREDGYSQCATLTVHNTATRNDEMFCQTNKMRTGNPFSIRRID